MAREEMSAEEKRAEYEKWKEIDMVCPSFLRMAMAVWI